MVRGGGGNREKEGPILAHTKMALWFTFTIKLCVVVFWRLVL